MPKLVTMNKAIVQKVIIDPIDEVLTVHFDVKDENGMTWKREKVLFWRTLPEVDEEGEPITEIPEHWYEIPQQKMPLLVEVLTVIRSAIENKILT
jgi:hypothetical protein